MNSSTSVIEAPVCGVSRLDSDFSAPEASRIRPKRRYVLAWIRGLLLALTTVFFALHFVHLAADFPNHSPWMDWSKYTDEGWYGDAAIRHLQRGRWYVPGDFNPAAAMPVWPLLEYLLFTVTGVTPVAARALTVAVFGAILVVAYVLVWRSLRKGGGSLAPEAVVLLLAVSPFCFVFTRLAILEPLLILLGLTALLVASTVPDREEGRALPWRKLAGPVVGLGVLMPLMVLTKTTAVFLLPSILWMLWASSGYRLRPFLRVMVPAAGLGAGLWALYFGIFVRPHFLEDYRYLFSANAYTGMTRQNWLTVMESTLRDGMWMGKLFYPAALIAVITTIVLRRHALHNPLVPALKLWVAGYAAFLAYHNNLQPRYYLVIAVPLTLLIPVVVEESLRTGAGSKIRAGWPERQLGIGLAVSGFVFIAGLDVCQTIGYVRAPEYTFTRAAQEVHRIVSADNRHNPLILSISGSELSLMTGLPSICDDFGTMTLEDRVAKYKPGWYATWNEVDDDKMDALSPMFHLERVAEFPAFDDPERNLLILYRLDPPQAEVPRKRRRKLVPKLLETKMGQQPSAVQLEH